MKPEAAEGPLRRRSLLLLGLLPFVAAAQGTRIVTVTRLVRLFLDKEIELLQAQRRGDVPAMEALLADDFAVIDAARPGSPIPRDEWLERAAHLPPPESIFEQAAAQDHGPVVVLSLLLRPTTAAGKAPEEPTFIIDAWVKAGDAWKLQSRYTAPQPPDATRSKPNAPVAPTGKD